MHASACGAGKHPQGLLGQDDIPAAKLYGDRLTGIGGERNRESRLQVLLALPLPNRGAGSRGRAGAATRRRAPVEAGGRGGTVAGLVRFDSTVAAHRFFRWRVRWRVRWRGVTRAIRVAASRTGRVVAAVARLRSIDDAIPAAHRPSARVADTVPVGVELVRVRYRGTVVVQGHGSVRVGEKLFECIVAIEVAQYRSSELRRDEAETALDELQEGGERYDEALSGIPRGRTPLASRSTLIRTSTVGGSPTEGMGEGPPMTPSPSM